MTLNDAVSIKIYVMYLGVDRERNHPGVRVYTIHWRIKINIIHEWKILNDLSCLPVKSLTKMECSIVKKLKFTPSVRNYLLQQWIKMDVCLDTFIAATRNFGRREYLTLCITLVVQPRNNANR